MANKCFLIVLIISFILISSVWAESQTDYLQSVEFLTGSGRGGLIGKTDYRIIPFIVDFDFNMKPLAKEFGFDPIGLLQFQIEPFINFAFQPETNMESGVSILFKLGLLPEDIKFQPYIKAGGGLIYLSQHTLDQSTQFDFLLNLGAGLHYFLKRDTAFTLEYRFRHLSNADIKQPNRGIDIHFALFGITYYFN